MRHRKTNRLVVAHEAVEHGGHSLTPGRIAVGMVFLPKTDLGAQERCRQIVETEIINFGYAIYGWRQVPIDLSALGEKATATRPRDARARSRASTRSPGVPGAASSRSPITAPQPRYWSNLAT